jgi:hypothetical protein
MKILDNVVEFARCHLVLSSKLGKIYSIGTMEIRKMKQATRQ